MPLGSVILVHTKFSDFLKICTDTEEYHARHRPPPFLTDEEWTTSKASKWSVSTQPRSFRGDKRVSITKSNYGLCVLVNEVGNFRALTESSIVPV